MYVLCFFEKFDFVITFIPVLKGVTKFIFENLFEKCKCEKFCFEQVPTSIYLLEKDHLYSRFRQHYPTIEK